MNRYGMLSKTIVMTKYSNLVCTQLILPLITISITITSGIEIMDG